MAPTATGQRIGAAKLQGRAVLFHIYSIDIGSLIDPDEEGQEGIDRLVRARADGSMSDRVADHGTSIGTFKGVSEEVQIIQRGQRAVRAGGRSIWSETILRREAPYLMVGALGPDLSHRSPSSRDSVVRFAPSEVQIRIFGRGSLSIMFRHTFDSEGIGDVAVEHFVDALAYVAGELAAEARTEIDKFLDAARTGQHHFAGKQAKWRSKDAVTSRVIRDNLVEHSLYFLEAVPGFDPIRHDHDALDLDNLDLHKSIAAVLDTNRLRDRYDHSYTQELIGSSTRWRDDELYITEHRRSLAVLADYWREGDSLIYYMEDLALAAAFELAKITHVRFLANYLAAVAPRFDVRNDESPGREEALRFVEVMQDAVSRSSYDDPTENLVSHKFTARFLAGISRERRTADSINAMADRTDSIAQRIQLQATMAIAEKALSHQRIAVFLSVFAVLTATVGIVLSLFAF